MVRHITLVDSGPNVYRLPEILARQGIRLSLIAPQDSILLRSKFVDNVTVLGDRRVFLADLIAAANCGGLDSSDMFVFGNDEMVRQLARSNLSDSKILRLIPFTRREGRPIAGSKAGLTRAIQQISVPAPDSVVVESPDQLPAHIATLGAPWVLKADGGGGARFLVRSGPTDSTSLVNSSWFPVVVQR